LKSVTARTYQPAAGTIESGARLVEELKQLVGRELDVLVTPLGGPVDTRDETAAMDPAKVALDKGIPAFVSSEAPAVRPRCHSPYSSHECFSRKSFSSAAAG
jgi:hypothetical protein